MGTFLDCGKQSLKTAFPTILPPRNILFSSSAVCKPFCCLQTETVFNYPLREKQVGEFIEIRHKNISPTRILGTLECLSLCDSVSNKPPIINFFIKMTPIEIGFLTVLAKKISKSAHFGPFGRHQFCPKTARFQNPLFEDISNFFVKMNPT